jgi:hypothetical protein
MKSNKVREEQTLRETTEGHSEQMFVVIARAVTGNKMHTRKISERGRVNIKQDLYWQNVGAVASQRDPKKKLLG